MKASVTCKYEDGKLQNRNGLLKVFKEFEGKPVLVTVEPKRRKRSLSQNAYLWGCVYPIIKNALKDQGVVWSIEDVHDYLKGEFLREECFSKESGLVLNRIKSTSEVGTIEFMEYVQSIQSWAIEYLGTNIPDPNEQLQIS